ncbi:hypothetical protein SAMN04487770_12951 [Butyrivibrio sp. ob235]|uniref:hypothetical protein n=1 Tax=Butyrivibrio sp. ob235 TaxID=1761780 RepID=UPI0008AD7320|nr:hypothetical protein [Butyrivibrio sp. ob235]SEM22938.1 hypothetical protein SAMN04487770_12951 [Butyrivibrio sp. ob235]
MDKCRFTLGIIIAIAMISACGKSKETNDNEPVDVVVETTEENDALSTEEATKIGSVSSVTEYLQYVDTEFLENEESFIETPAVNCYEEFLNDKNNWPDSEYDSIHIALGLIDDDDVPELCVTLNTNTVCGVHIYKYNSDSDSVIYLGEFSQYGFCWYSEKKNRIKAQYGNQGYFENYFYEIADSSVQVVGRLLSDGSSEVMKCYADYAEETETSPDHTHLDSVKRPEDKFIISEEEYEHREEEYMQSKEPIKIGYDNMTEMILDNE